MDEDVYLNLVCKELEGSLTEAEAQALAEWLSVSAANKAAAEEIREAWAASESLLAQPAVDLDAEFQLLDDRIAADEAGGPEAAPTPVVRRLWWQRPATWAVAAAVLLLAVAGYIFLPGGNPPAAEWLELAATDAPAALTLPDGSRIALNRGASLRYPRAFVGEQREVKLRGEGWFEVERDAAHPFVVATADAKVTVLGTSFQVKEAAGGATEVHVRTGKVRLAGPEGQGALELGPGDAAAWEPAQQAARKLPDSHPNDLAWHTRKLVYDDAPLAMALEELGQLHDALITADDALLAGCPLTMTFDHESLAVSLETICGVLGCTVESGDNKTYTLKGGTCQ